MFIQNMKVPTPEEKYFEINSYTKGLINSGSSFGMPHDAFPNSMNALSYQEGILESRPGLFKHILAQIPETIHAIYAYETQAFKCFMLCSKTKLYKNIIGTETVTEVCTVSDTITGVQLDTKFYFVDGVKYREYDGTNVYEVIAPFLYEGKATGGAVGTITLPSDANATNDYYKNCVIYTVSGTGSGQTRTITAYNGTTKVATVDTNWTTAPDNTTVFYLANGTHNSVNENSTDKTKWYIPSYLEFKDAFKGANNIDMANDCKQIVLHKNRLWFANSTASNIAFSTDIDNPYYVPTNSYTPAITNNADYVKGLYSFNDVLVFFKEGAIFALYGNDETDYDLKEVTVPTGTVNIRTVCKVDNFLYYFGPDGYVYALFDVRTDVKKMIAKQISTQISLVKEPLSVNPKYWVDSLAIHFDRFYILCVKDKMLINVIGGGWYPCNGLAPTAMIVRDNNILLTNANRYLYKWTFNRFYITETFTALAGQTDFVLRYGYVEEIKEAKIQVNSVDVGMDERIKVNNKTIRLAPCSVGQTVSVEYLSMLSYNDDGQAYTCYWNSQDLFFGYTNRTKQLRRISVLAHTFKYFTSTFHFKTFIDYYQVESGVELRNQISMWGFSVFGDRFIDRNIIDSIPIEVNQRGKVISFRVESECNDNPFVLYKINGTAIIRDK